LGWPFFPCPALFRSARAGAVLAGLVDRLDGGSFAVAGPRGAG
jgi:hypothetical protein